MGIGRQRPEDLPAARSGLRLAAIVAFALKRDRGESTHVVWLGLPVVHGLVHRASCHRRCYNARRIYFLVLALPLWPSPKPSTNASVIAAANQSARTAPIRPRVRRMPKRPDPRTQPRPNRRRTQRAGRECPDQEGPGQEGSGQESPSQEGAGQQKHRHPETTEAAQDRIEVAGAFAFLPARLAHALAAQRTATVGDQSASN
jgi:hypothetical protein